MDFSGNVELISEFKQKKVFYLGDLNKVIN
jgi:hypothetical protein